MSFFWHHFTFLLVLALTSLSNIIISLHPPRLHCALVWILDHSQTRPVSGGTVTFGCSAAVVMSFVDDTVFESLLKMSQSVEMLIRLPAYCTCLFFPYKASFIHSHSLCWIVPHWSPEYCFCYHFAKLRTVHSLSLHSSFSVLFLVK